VTDFVLERGRRLSESLLWRLQKRFFDAVGDRAWAHGIVPHYITGNGWIADAYAKVVLGWLRDHAGTLDPRQPVTLLEIGCGSGRFGYLFFLRLLDLLERSSLRHLPVRFVMTDFTESTLAPLRGNPLFHPWIERGVLDFARYDAAADGEIRLDLSGEVIAPGTLGNPLAVLANYVFDGIPQDAFAVRGGRLRELLATLTAPDEEEDLDEPTLLQRVELSWEESAAVDEPYGDPELDAILREYAGKLDDTAVLFPSAAIRCLRRLGRLADGRLLLVAGDKGYCREELLAGREEPALSIHGSFSLMVNFHALGEWIARRGGKFLYTSHIHSSLCVIAGVLGAPPGGAVETALAFDDAIERRGPDDFFDLKVGFGHAWDDLTLEHLLGWIRLSGWDATVLLDAWPALMKHAAPAAGVFRLEIYRTVHEVWNHYFPLQEARDLAFLLGVLLCEIDCHGDALPFFHESAAVYGPNPATVFNIGLCLFELGHLEEAREQVEAALAEAPDFAPALELRGEIRAALREEKTKGTQGQQGQKRPGRKKDS
jgi:hypothetical protein